MNRMRKGARRTTVVVASTTASLIVISGLAFAADLKADLNLGQNGVQQNKDLGEVIGGNTYTFTDNLYLMGQDSVTSATFDDDGDLPSWVSSVSGGVARKGDLNAAVSTITVVAPCSVGVFGAQGGNTRMAGSSVQYKVLDAVGAASSEIGVSSAWVNVRGNVTAVGPNCSSDTTKPAGSIRIDDNAAWTNDSTAAVSVDLSATDNVGVTRYRLAASQAGLAAAPDVAVSPAATDFSAADLAFTLDGTEGANKEVWVRYYDAANNFVDASDTIGWDKTGPIITDDSVANPPAGTQGSGGWWTTPVEVTFSASDNLSGFSGKSNPYTFTANSAAVEGIGVTVSSGTVDDVAGNTSNSATSSAFNIDLTNPSVACVTPAPTFVLGSTSQVSAIVTDDVSGPAASPAFGDADTTSVGSRSATVTGYDNAGRFTSVSCAYNVVYDWTGFFRPVDNLPTLNSVKAGSAIPVKFNLAGNQGLDIMESGYPKSQTITCDNSSPIDALEETVTAGSSSLTYDATAGHYTYVWKTDKAWAGTCRQLIITLKDGTIHRANFKLLK